MAKYLSVIPNLISENLLVALNACMGNCNDTVNDKSDPVGNITDLFRLDFGIFEGNVWLMYLTEVSLASFNEFEENLYVALLGGEAWHKDTMKKVYMTKFWARDAFAIL